MPDQEKQDSAQQPPASQPISSDVIPPTPKGFVAYLRAEIRQATRIVMEEIMREELTQFVGAEWGENSPNRTGYRNGYYTRDLLTTNGLLDNLQVPRDRAGDFHTQVFERYSRYEPQIAELSFSRVVFFVSPLPERGYHSLREDFLGRRAAP